MTVTDPREIGAAAWRRGAEPFAIRDPHMVAVLPTGPDSQAAQREALLAWFDGYDAAKAAGEPQAVEEAPRAALTITHSPAEGTRLHGTSQGDGVAAVLRAVGETDGPDGRRVRVTWRWARNAGVWWLRGTRNTARPGPELDRTREALEAAGYSVTVELSDERRSVAEQEAERAERAAARSERLTARADRLAKESDARAAASRAIGEHIPMGQPVLVGHHSQRKHERALERMERHDRKAWELHKEAEEAARRAGTAVTHQAHRESAPVTRRRIERLEAQLRRAQRGQEAQPYQSAERLAAAREHWAPIQAELEEELAYWRAHLAALEEQGVKVWSRADFTKGDFVQHDGMWSRVLRVNAKSLSVPHWEPRLADSHTWTVSYDRVTGRKAAETA